MVTIAYFTQDEFNDFGFDEVEEFEKLKKKREKKREYNYRYMKKLKGKTK